MTIRRRILILSGTGTAVMLLAVAQFYRLSSINFAISVEGTRAADTHTAVQQIDLLAYDYLLYGEMRTRRQLNLKFQLLRQGSMAFQPSSGRYQQAIALELQRAEALLTAIESQRHAPPGEYSPNALRSRYLAEQLIISSLEMFDQARRWQAQIMAARAGLLREATLSALIASSALLVLLMAGALLLLRMVVRPVERLRQAVAAVAAGDLGQRVPVDREDELGVLSAGFNTMAQSLEEAALERIHTFEVEARSAVLERVNNDLEHFAALASHDLQAPLRTVINFTELVQRRAGDQLDERSRSHLERIIEATVRMRSLIESLLRFARAESVDISQDTDVSCRTAVDKALENLAQAVSDSGAVVDIGELPLVRFDAIQLIQVFQNLIGNAIKYRDRERPLRIRITTQPSEEGWHVIAVTDNGPGINLQHHQQIFDMFQRLHTSEIAGSGIGLALCRKIVKTRGGDIHVESTPGQGATFIFDLPAATGVPPAPRVSRRLQVVVD